MVMPKVRARLETLRSQIRHHDYLYYVLDRPQISDQDYDRLFAELTRLETKNPDLVTRDSPTQRVAGAPLSMLPSARHLAPMLSLEAVTAVDDVERFLERVRERGFTAEPKLDGLSIEVIYEEGRLARAITRGDGQVGEEVTANVKTIRSVPLVLRGARWPSLLGVRGEVVMPLARFERLEQGADRRWRRCVRQPP